MSPNNLIFYVIQNNWQQSAVTTPSDTPFILVIASAIIFFCNYFF